MRFLKAFLLVLSVTVFLLAVGGWLAFEGYLYLASRPVTSAFYMVRRLALNEEGRYVIQCREEIKQSSAPNKNPIKPLSGFQLRFVSPTAYVIEAVCNSDYVEPLRISEGNLWQGVKKVNGNGAKIEGNLNQALPTGWITLQSFLGKQRLVGWVEGKVWNTPEVRPMSHEVLASSPTTTCQGASGHCRLNEAQSGMGVRIEASDCPGNCYYTCLNRPNVSRLETVPGMDLNTRELMLYGPRVAVDFNYRILDADGYVKEAYLFFGDGVQEKIEGEKFVPKSDQIKHDLDYQTQHEYICREALCVYEVKLVALDNDDLGLSESRFNKMFIYQVVK